MKTIVLFVLSLLICSFAHASKRTSATVEKVRGHVTQLAPGALMARKLQKGDQLVEDTSILTRDSSFTRIKLVDGTVISLGPRSKFVITKVGGSKTQKLSTTVISLLKGKIRTEAEKQKKNHVYIQTKSAAMAVRGTEFQTIYNPSNNLTSLLTYKGEVAMAQIERPSEIEALDVEHSTEVVRDEQSGEVELKKRTTRSKENMRDRFEEILKKKKAKVVKSGQYSGTVQKFASVSTPVPISPVQLDTLYKNVEMVEKKRRKETNAAKTDNLKQKFTLKSTKSDAPPEGVFDAKAKTFAPKSGGFIDLNTGLYVPPAKDSEFNRKLGLYVPKASGTVDAQTGQYVPPKGLRLDPKEGFIVNNKKKDDTKLLAMAGALNKEVSADLVVGELPEEKSRAIFSILSNKERFNKETLSFSLYTFKERIRTTDTTDGFSNSRLSDGGQFGADISWAHKTGWRWQPITAISIRSVDFSPEQRGNIGQGSKALFGMRGGLRYFLNNRWNAKAMFEINQGFYVYHNTNESPTTAELTRVSVPRFKISAEGSLVQMKGGRFSLDMELGAMATLGKKAGNFKVDSGYGWFSELGTRYWFSRKYWMKALVQFDSLKNDVKGESFKANTDTENYGAALQFGSIY